VPYAQRFAVVEPVLGHLRANKRLDGIKLRGRTKVDTPWELYCLVHNIERCPRGHRGVGGEYGATANSPLDQRACSRDQQSIAAAILTASR
jgi:hypothetical protein